MEFPIERVFNTLTIWSNQCFCGCHQKEATSVLACLQTYIALTGRLKKSFMFSIRKTC